MRSTTAAVQPRLGVIRHGWVALLAAANLTLAVVALAQPHLVGVVVDDLTLGRSATGSIVALAAVALTGLAVEAVAALGATYSSSGLTRELRVRSLGHVLASGPSILSRLGAGDLVTRLSVDASEPGSLLPTIVSGVVSAAVGVGALVALWLVHWSIAVAFLVGLPVFAFLLRRFYVDTASLFGRYRSIQSEIGSRLVDANEGSRTISVSGTLPREVRRVSAPVSELSGVGRQLWAAQRRVGWQAGFGVAVMQCLVLAAAGVALAHHEITTGGLVAALMYSGIALGALDGLEGLSQAAQGRVGVGRMLEILASPLPTAGRRAVPDGPLDVELRGVTVEGADGPLLEDVDLHVEAGRRVALVGRSGSGKSTCAGLLGRLTRPASGEVLLGGVPLQEIADDDLHRSVAYVFERPARLGSTLTEMVTLGRSDRDATAAARLAQVDRFVQRLPAGWRTAPQDAPLSGGEWQRLGIARAVAAAAPILVLDDATSSLDTLTEAAVLDALDRLSTGHTALVLTHRPGVAARADEVVWLDAGRVRGRGSHAALWNDPDYRAVFDCDAEGAVA